MELAKKQLMKLLDINESKITIPPDASMGDYSSTIAFDKAKESNENPNLTAIKLISDIMPKLARTVFSTVKTYGPYINFYLDREKVISTVLSEVLKEDNNYSAKKKTNKKLLIESPSPNTNKPLHLGHLKNVCIGLSMSRIFENRGYDVKRLNLYNDRGIHICKSMLAYNKWGRNKKPNKKTDHFVGDYYVLFDKKNENDKLMPEARLMLKKWEDGDKETLKLWKKMNAWAYKGYEQTFKIIGLPKFDKVYYESSIYKKGKEIVMKGVEKGVFKKEGNSIFAELGKLGRMYLIREDGTALYGNQDLALAEAKSKDFTFEKSIVITGNEQNHYFKQLFAIFKLLNYGFADKCEHLGYGMVLLPSGKMKSREGTVVDADDLIEEMSTLAKYEMKKRKNKADMKTTLKIGLSAIKYDLLRVKTSKDVTFNPEESISFEGNTGPYLLYSLVRAKKILKKNKKKLVNRVKPKDYKQEEEFKLIKTFAELKTSIKSSMKELSPHHLCNYAHELASQFNKFYDACPVMQAEDTKTITARLLLVKAFIIVMKKCLYLLGIEAVDKM